ncbi:MAG: DUF928 domain-containing protein [Hormoscilla sp.]
MQKPAYLASIAATMTLGLLLGPAFTSQAQQTFFQPPAGQKQAPVNTAGGASRGQCPLDANAGSENIIPLMPAMLLPEAPMADLVGLTTAANPTFFVYVPSSKTGSAMFSLKDAQNNDVYQTSLQLPEDGGIVAIKIPESAGPLKVGQKYVWSFGIICTAETPEDSSPVMFVAGEVQRTEASPTIKSQLAEANLLKQAAIYAQNGIWVEAVTTLAQLRQSQPENSKIAAEWKHLLGSVGLEAIASVPLVSGPQN